jgi:hypothetical protein
MYSQDFADPVHEGRYTRVKIEPSHNPRAEAVVYMATAKGFVCAPFTRPQLLAVAEMLRLAAHSNP